MNTVLIYRERLLHISETFIAAQTAALREFQPKYVGLVRPVPSLALDGEPIYLATRQGIYSKIRERLYLSAPLAPVFHRRIRKQRAALIHAHFAPNGIRATRLASMLRIPLIVTLHGLDVTVRQDFTAQYSTLWKKASLFICVSDFIRRKAIEAGFPPEKLVVHYIGIDTKKFHVPVEPRTPGLILFVGRLTEKKGCDTLLRAMAIVHDANPTASLVLIGDGPLRSSLEGLASSLHLSCQFLGPQPAGIVQKWMQRASILCAPSQTAPNGDSEGLPIVVLEAMAVGLPVVSTFHAGIPEAICHHKTGLLVPERDPVALAQSLLHDITSPALAGEYGLAASVRVNRDFNLSTQSALLEGIYRKVLCEAAQRENSASRATTPV